MITLGLDTTGAYCTAALVDASKVLAQKSENIGRGHAERLAPMVAEIMVEANLAAPEVERLAVCTGPGSFTGLRVALAFAKGFALPRKTPIIGISALEVLAAQVDPHKEKRVVSVIDVRRGELCWAFFEKRAVLQTPVTQKLDDAKAAIKRLGYDRAAGDGAEHIGEDPVASIVSGPALAWISQDLNPENYPPVPLYSRGPDAKLPGGIDPAAKP